MTGMPLEVHPRGSMQEALRKEELLLTLLPSVDDVASQLDTLEGTVQSLDKASHKLLKRAQALKPAA